MITRLLEQPILKRFYKKKAIIVHGPRQSGKTTLIQKILKSVNDLALFLNGDDSMVIKLLSNANTIELKQIIGKHKIVFIDEAQRIPNIGITAKIIVDMFPSVQLILSGSSAFELSQKTQEPLTGRKWTFYLWPVSWEEWQNYAGYLFSEQDLETRLVLGFYPDILMQPDDAKTILKELTESYLYKDILIYGNIKKPLEIQKLVQALAYQVGNEVSLRELAEMVNIDPKTIDKYISILESAYIIFRLTPYSRNLRNELKTNKKIYFYDNGIRNAVINQLQPLKVRNDIGILWENFLISERIKYLDCHQISANKYFWRTLQQQEIDYIEERDGKLFAYEFKWSDTKKVKFSKTFTQAYQAENSVVHRNNFREFIMKHEVGY